MDIITKYFPNLTDKQKLQYAQLQDLYNDWNAKINVISRKDIQNLYEHHVLHSLGIAEVIRFRPGTTIMDLGSGGGFPGIPLAIMFPDTNFHLVDSIGKKIKVAQAIADSIGLTNVCSSHARGEDIKEKYDFIVTRAVMTLSELMRCASKNVKMQQRNSLPNGILALKGGELDTEIAPMKKLCTVWDLSQFFNEEYFSTKKLVHVSVKN